MKAGFTFTDSPPGGPFRVLPGVLYEVHDIHGNLITQNEAGEQAIVELSPGKYCIFGTRHATVQNSIYFGELAFEVPTEIPWHPPMDPPPSWDVHFIVYMAIIPHLETDDMPETSCPQQWPQDENGNGNGDGDGDGDGMGGVLLILIIIGVMAAGGALHAR